MSKKRRWIIKIRALRRKLKALRDNGDIDKATYRKLYNKSKGGDFRSIAHLEGFIESNKLLKAEEKENGERTNL